MPVDFVMDEASLKPGKAYTLAIKMGHFPESWKESFARNKFKLVVVCGGAWWMYESYKVVEWWWMGGGWMEVTRWWSGGGWVVDGWKLQGGGVVVDGWWMDGSYKVVEWW